MSRIGCVICVPRKLELSALRKFELVALGAAGKRVGPGRVSRGGLGGRGAVGALSGGVWGSNAVVADGPFLL